MSRDKQILQPHIREAGFSIGHIFFETIGTVVIEKK